MKITLGINITDPYNVYLRIDKKDGDKLLMICKREDIGSYESLEMDEKQVNSLKEFINKE